MEKNLPVYELTFDSEDNKTGVEILSLVHSNAMQSNFIAFSKQLEKTSIEFKIADEEKKIISGVVAIPNKEIYRIDDKTGKEYYVKMSEQTIEQMMIKFFKRGFTNNVNEEHSSKINNVFVFESWLTAGEQDKSTKLFGLLPVNTWCASMKVEDEKTWSKVKSGVLQGFSLQGDFFMESTKDKTDAEKFNELNELFNRYKNP